MKISYHKDTDSLYVHLSGVPTAESEEVARDTVLHFDEGGNVTGFEIYAEASEKADLSVVETFGIVIQEAMKTGRRFSPTQRTRMTVNSKRKQSSKTFKMSDSSLGGKKRYRKATVVRSDTREAIREENYGKIVALQGVS